MKKLWSLVAICLPILVFQGFKSNALLANSSLSLSEPALTVQYTSPETLEITIEPPLTSEQQMKLQEINGKYQPQIQAAAQEYVESLRVIDGLFGTNPSNEVIRNSFTQAQNSRNKLSNLLVDRLIEFRSALSPEQQASIADDIRSFLETKPEL